MTKCPNKKVSVCLASYNGEKYISQQICSILSQLAVDDELIICDDCSRDDTCQIINKINDPRIKLFTYSLNIGHVKNFERAINSSSGDLIFLSDQDDLWESHKYERIINIFDSNLNIKFIHHSLSTIDVFNTITCELYNSLNAGPQSRLPFLTRQLIKYEIFGCGIAFRREILKYALPFPKYTYAHDHWLGIVSGICSSVFYLNEPLVRYRQHDFNLTPKNGLSIFSKLLVRMKLFYLILISLFRLIFK